MTCAYTKMDIQFRIHRAYSDVSGFVVSLFEKCEKGFMFQHEADEEVNRQHVHGYMFNPTVTRKTLSEQIAQKLNLKGNTDFFTSTKCSRRDPRPIDLSGAWVYGSKFDTIAPSFMKNISPDSVEELRARARKWDYHKLASKSAPTTDIVVLKEIKVKSKPTQYQHVTEVLKIINETRPDLYNETSAQQRRQIFEICYNYWQSHEMFMGKYKQLDFLDMVLMKWNCKEYKKALFDDFLKRTSPYSL